jgi:hypothetical protein
MPSNKKKICVLLKGIETGDPKSVTVVNEGKYIQHLTMIRNRADIDSVFCCSMARPKANWRAEICFS